MSNWKEVENIASDEERQKAYLTGVGDYGGNDQDNEITIRQTIMPSEE